MKLKELLKIMFQIEYIKIYDNENLIYYGIVKERFKMVDYDSYKERTIAMIYSDKLFFNDDTDIIIILK